MNYEVRTEPWERGLVIHIYDDQGNFFGMTQTHVGYPEDTVEAMARTYVISWNHLPSDAEIDIVYSSLPPKE